MPLRGLGGLRKRPLWPGGILRGTRRGVGQPGSGALGSCAGGEVEPGCLDHALDEHPNYGQGQNEVEFHVRRGFKEALSSPAKA